MIQTLINNSPLLYLTQSIWRDEAFSLLIAQKPISYFFSGSLTFEPPLYYTLLHLWVRFFGPGEISARVLSLLGVGLATVVVIVWAEKLFKDRLLQWTLPALFFFNPMIIYYAFEIRTYGWYIFFITLALFAYDQKKWNTYIAAVVLGFYTHTFMIFVPFVTLLHHLLHHWTRLKKNPLKTLQTDPVIRSSIISGVLILPWLLLIAIQVPKLQSSWYYPVDLQLARSVLGNMFVGYEGTPWYGWQYTAALSGILLLFFLYSLTDKKHLPRRSYFFMMIMIPLAVTISASAIKPLYVNRYLLYVTISELLLLVLTIQLLKSKGAQYTVIGMFVLGTLAVNIWFPSQHSKVNIRKTIKEINAVAGPQDVIYAGNPLILFETQYYADSNVPVYLYNPEGNSFPWYVGDAAFDPSIDIASLPLYPKRAFLIQKDGSYSIEYQMPTTYIGQNVQQEKSDVLPRL